jgi:hypothetical protein
MLFLIRFEAKQNMRDSNGKSIFAAFLTLIMIATSVALAGCGSQGVQSNPLQSSGPPAPPSAPAATVKLCDDETQNPNCTAKDTFSLAQIRDLFIWVNWQNVPTGTHSQEIDIYMAQGNSLYVSYWNNFLISDTPQGSATVMRSMPVAGTAITQRQLTGSWEVQVLLDGKLITSKTFQFNP